MREFTGERDAKGRCRVYIHNPDVPGARLTRLRHRPYHGQDIAGGFDWGYGGAGPMRLARALVAEVTGVEDPPTSVCQRFKARVVQQLVGTTWTLNEQAVREQVEAIMAETHMIPRREDTDG